MQYSISDHLPIFCIASSAKHKNPFKNSTHYYRNIKNLNGNIYRDDLYDTFTSIVQKFQTSSISASNFDLHFNNLVIGINKVIEKHAPLQKVSRKLSGIRQKPWMTFKTAKVIPIFKSGNREILGNYRPIALLSNLSKILEKLIKIQFDKFFFLDKVLYANQYGFRNNHSVNHALLDVVTNCYDALHCSQHTALLFMDLRKAFDIVSHKILLHKLHHYGIRGPAYALIENYLTSRNQFVTFNNTSSSTKPINIGLPQGSILGPLLFLIYINNLPNVINSTPRLFADDTCLILRQSSLLSLEKACLDELIQLKDWCDANKIQINLNKSCILHLPPKQNTPPLTFQIPYDNSFIVNSICCKYLGILIDNKLNLKQHIGYN